MSVIAGEGLRAPRDTRTLNGVGETVYTGSLFRDFHSRPTSRLLRPETPRLGASVDRTPLGTLGRNKMTGELRRPWEEGPPRNEGWDRTGTLTVPDHPPPRERLPRGRIRLSPLPSPVRPRSSTGLSPRSSVHEWPRRSLRGTSSPGPSRDRRSHLRTRFRGAHLFLSYRPRCPQAQGCAPTRERGDVAPAPTPAFARAAGA